MKSHHLRVSAALAAMLALAGCSTPSEPHAPGQLTKLPRDLTPAEQKLIGASNAFSFALWNQVNAQHADSNVFISPLSASFALGMTLNGAANQTFDEMRTALQVQGVSQHDINAGYQSLVALLTSLDPHVAMQVANSIWYRQDFPVTQAFLDTTRSYFDAEVQALDFANTDASLKTINGWVDRKTNGRITGILDGIDPLDMMFLINALYFKGSWRTQFDPGLTTGSRFTTASGATQTMRLMHLHSALPYAETSTYQAVDLPYGNGAFTMTVLLPKPGTSVDMVARSLTEAGWRSLVAGFDSTTIDLGLPKFRLTDDRSLNPELAALGMVVPFQEGFADFTRMSPMGKKLFLSFVRQKTFVDVNEEGTEAAAVTAVGIRATAAPVNPVMIVDRPFLFFIRERLSGTVLFMGKVVRMP